MVENGFFDTKGLPIAVDTGQVEISLDEMVEHPQLDKEAAEQMIRELQTGFSLVHQAYVQQGLRAMIVFEGTDAAGKGGIIRRMSTALDPHHAHVWPIAAPQYEERDHHYLYRFWKRLPVIGELSIYDRSWYGRVLVERVEELTSRKDWQRAYAEINHFERLLTDDGIRIVKFMLHISKDEQEARFVDRLRKPSKRYKLTVADFNGRQHWKDYQLAFQDMIEQTSTAYSPWHVVPANSKPFARVAVMRTLLNALEHNVDTSRVTELSDSIRHAAEVSLGKNVVSDALKKG